HEGSDALLRQAVFEDAMRAVRLLHMDGAARSDEDRAVAIDEERVAVVRPRVVDREIAVPRFAHEAAARPRPQHAGAVNGDAPHGIEAEIAPLTPHRRPRAAAIAREALRRDAPHDVVASDRDLRDVRRGQAFGGAEMIRVAAVVTKDAGLR